jgi:hypothetical protein
MLWQYVQLRAVLINRLKTKRRLLYLKTQYVLYRAVNTFHLGYKNQSFQVVWGRSRCWFSDKHKTNTVWAGRTLVEC